MANKILFFTDIHWGIHTNSEKYLSICENTMKWIKSVCKTKNITVVVFGGDYFDSRSTIDISTMHKATDALYDLSEHTKIILSLGNHDIYLRDSTSINSLNAYTAHKNITVLNKPLIINDTTIVCPWGYGVYNDDMSNFDLTNIKVAIMHHDYPKDFFMGSKHISKTNHSDSSTMIDDEYNINPSLFANLNKNHGLFISGHIHHRRELPFGNCRMVIAGSPYETEYGFKDLKTGCYIIDTDTCEYEFIENPYNIKHIEIRTSKFDDIDLTTLKNAFVRLRVDTNDTNVQKSNYISLIRENLPYSIDNSIFDFEVASFVGNRDTDENPLTDIGNNVMSKLDYIYEIIDSTDFTNCLYKDKDNNDVSITKDIIKNLAETYFEKVSK